MIRETKETKIEADLKPYGSGRSDILTNVGFFDHMLESFSKHSQMDISLKCEGDLHVDSHHCVEDVGIVLGSAFKSEVYPLESIERFGEASIVMDDACVECVVDISNRAYLYFDIPVDGKVGEFDVELVEEFFRAFVLNAGISAHIVYKRGKNKHHIIEASFKALAVALRRALKKDESLGILSTKGVL